jgi:hypothetical protein
MDSRLRGNDREKKIDSDLNNRGEAFLEIQGFTSVIRKDEN